MYSVVIIFQPFVINQAIMLYQNGNIIENYQTPIENIVNTINSIKQQYEISSINLVGNKDYLLNFKGELSTIIPKAEINIMN